MNLKTTATLTAALLLASGTLAAPRAAAQEGAPRQVERQTIQIPQPPARSWVGLSGSVRNMGPMVITGVEEGSPAEVAGFHVGDTIVAVDGRDALASPRPNFRQLAPGTEYRVRVRRGTEEVDLVLVPAAPPAETSRR